MAPSLADAVALAPVTVKLTVRFLIPFPNKHEMFGNMLSGQVAHTLVLLDADLNLIT